MKGETEAQQEEDCLYFTFATFEHGRQQEKTCQRHAVVVSFARPLPLNSFTPGGEFSLKCFFLLQCL